MTDTWKMNLGKGMIVDAVFVDFKKTFDSISHNILSLKLQGPVVQKPINANPRLKINHEAYFSTPKCCSTLIFE